MCKCVCLYESKYSSRPTHSGPPCSPGSLGACSGSTQNSKVRPASAPRVTVRQALKPSRSVSVFRPSVRGHGISQRVSPTWLGLR